MTRDADTGGENALVELVDRLIDRGIVLRGELWLAVAGVDLVFVGVDSVIASADRVRRDRARAAAGGPR